MILFHCRNLHVDYFIHCPNQGFSLILSAWFLRFFVSIKYVNPCFIVCAKKIPHITCIDLMQKILCFLCFLLLLMWIFSNKCTNYQNCLPLFKKWILGEQIHVHDPYFDIRYNLYQVRWRTWIKVLKNIFYSINKINK